MPLGSSLAVDIRADSRRELSANTESKVRSLDFHRPSGLGLVLFSATSCVDMLACKALSFNYVQAPASANRFEMIENVGNESKKKKKPIKADDVIYISFLISFPVAMNTGLFLTYVQYVCMRRRKS